MQPYRSCNCRYCRRVTSGVKRHHKDTAHRAFRRESRLAADHPVRLAAAAIGRQALHAWRLSFDHPRTGRRVRVEAPLPEDIRAGSVRLVGQYAVYFGWSDGHSTGIYPYEFLLGICPCAECVARGEREGTAG